MGTKDDPLAGLAATFGLPLAICRTFETSIQRHLGMALDTEDAPGYALHMTSPAEQKL